MTPLTHAQILTSLSFDTNFDQDLKEWKEQKLDTTVILDEVTKFYDESWIADMLGFDLAPYFYGYDNTKELERLHEAFLNELRSVGAYALSLK